MKKTKSVSPVLLSSNVGTGVMRGRDVREKLQGKLDPTSVVVIAKIAEINHTNCTAIAEILTQQEQIINLIQQFSDIAENMKLRTDKLVSAQESLEGSGEYDAGPTEH